MNTLTPDIVKLSVNDAMSEVSYTIAPTDKIENVATQLIARNINAALVVDDVGKCIGIITSNDIVRFQSQHAHADSQVNHGMSFEIVQREVDGSLHIISHPFDEVQCHMTSTIQTIAAEGSLQMAAKMMWHEHIHHLIVLDKQERPVGILSSLDILAKLTGEK